MDIKKRLKKIKTFISDVSDCKVDLAIALYNAKAEENWKESPYRSWKGFCSEKVALSHSSIYVYTKTIKLAIDNQFRRNDIYHIVNKIGWERFRLGLTKLGKDEQVNVVTFIKRFKNLNLNERIIFENDASALIDFSFSLPKDVAESLTKELVMRGMRVTNKSRVNASAALIKLVNEVAEQ